MRELYVEVNVIPVSCKKEIFSCMQIIVASIPGCKGIALSYQIIEQRAFIHKSFNFMRFFLNSFYCMIYSCDYGRRSPTYFTSKMQATVSLSSTKAEYNTLRTVTQEVLYQAQKFDELFGKEHKKPSIVYEDNLGTIYFTKNLQISQRTKHIDVRHHFIKVLLELFTSINVQA